MAEYITRMSAVAVVKRYEFEKCPEYMQDWATKLKRAILDDLTEDLMNLPAADVVTITDVTEALGKLRTLEQAMAEGRLVMEPRKPFTPPTMEVVSLDGGRHE